MPGRVRMTTSCGPRVTWLHSHAKIEFGEYEMWTKWLRSVGEDDGAEAARVDPAYRVPRAARADPAHREPAKWHGACDAALSYLCENGKKPARASLLQWTERVRLRTAPPCRVRLQGRLAEARVLSERVLREL